MRALVIGAGGQVGEALARALRERGHQVLATFWRVPVEGAARLDVTDEAAVESAVSKAAPGWIFCPAGMTAVDYCEDHIDEARRANMTGPLAAARAGARLGAGFTYFSSEYVFDGEAGPYGEDDPPRPLSVYGRTKLEGERAVLGEIPRSQVVRTTVVYGVERQEKNFVYQLLRALRAGEAMRVPKDQLSSPTYSPDLASACVELAELGVSGVFHLAGSEVMDRYAFALVACRVFDLDPSRLIPVATASLNQRARRPLKGGLRIDRARALLRSELRPPEGGLRAMREALAAAPAGVSHAL
jgi:dTDP-4-dehydrorhamnose reductase